MTEFTAAAEAKNELKTVPDWTAGGVEACFASTGLRGMSMRTLGGC